MTPPRPLLAPRLGSGARLDRPLAVDPGLWEGATAIALQWCRDGDPIAGATGSAYTPADEDDGAALSVRVRASGPGGESLAETEPVRVTCAAPVAKPLVLDDVFDAGTGLQVVPAAHAFAGRALRFTAEGAGATADPRTGEVFVPTDRPTEGEDVVVTARNSGGADHLVFRVAIEGEAGEDLAQTRRTSELVADGVTFRFADAAETGAFITGAAGAGDPFVVGPVTLLGYDPGPARLPGGREVNGAMVNPPCGRTFGFDSIARKKYDPALNAGLRLPLRLEPGDSLVVAVSDPSAEESKRSLDRFVVLTCLAETPPADAFRPPYSGSEKPLHRLGDIDLSRLARLEIHAADLMPPLAELEARFARFAMDPVPNWNRDFLRADKHPPHYGRGLCHDEAAPYVWVNSAMPDAHKLRLVLGLVQRGIDRYGVFRSAREQGFQPWRGSGGHNSGRKFSIMFAGHLLDVDEMRHVVRQTPPGAGFQEDEMTFHIAPEHVEATNGPDWDPSYEDRRPQQPYPPAMIGTPEWRGRREPEKASASWTGHPYRLVATHNAMHGQTLAALAMGLQDAWGHDAYFDYHIRFMEIMNGAYDPWRFRGGKQALYNPVTGSRRQEPWPGWQRRWHDEWSWQMLKRHRFDFYRFPWS
ncbi:hypothetical protein [Roseitranquillus sediminis]|uniref:hypothetical protein n=1 Tax=Roseitranquillus sediminis TaxID=2809051 RepID=UPI001D0CB111|nr:hypothetical protein [Roseitranquillus sediminis]MBM9593927.1 hypothetical protein [Roseitranquillus sediminis]